MAIKKAKVFTITSVKGGTGKSTTTLSLAGVLSEEKIKTIIVDLDLSSGTIASSLNTQVHQDVYSLVDDMMNNRFTQIDKYISNYNEYIDVLPAPIDPRNTLKIYPQYIENVIRQLEYKYDVILIDTNHVISEINLTAFDQSDKIIYIFTDDLMDLKNMKTMIAIFEDMQSDKYITVLNEVFNRKLTDFEIKTVLGKETNYIIPKAFFEEDIKKYILEGKILSIEKPKNKGTLVLKKLIIDNIK